MARAPFQVLVFPFRFLDSSIEYAIFKRANSEVDFWQALSGGGEDTETPLETAKRETWEESKLPMDSTFIPLDSRASIPVIFFGDGLLWGKDKYVIPEYCFGLKVGNQKIDLSSEHSEYKWLNYSDAHNLLRFDSNKIGLWELNERLQKEYF